MPHLTQHFFFFFWRNHNRWQNHSRLQAPSSGSTEPSPLDSQRIPLTQHFKAPVLSVSEPFLYTAWQKQEVEPVFKLTRTLTGTLIHTITHILQPLSFELHPLSEAMNRFSLLSLTWCVIQRSKCFIIPYFLFSLLILDNIWRKALGNTFTSLSSRIFYWPRFETGSLTY